MTTALPLGLNTHENSSMTGDTSNTIDTNANDDQPQLTVAQAPSLCRLCDVELTPPQTWRTHVKSDGHVHKLRLKVAEPGRSTAPLPSLSSPDVDERQAVSSWRIAKNDEPSIDDEHAEEVDSGSEDESLVSESDPGKCLFCGEQSSTLDDNMVHMAASHGFSVPYQDCLAVELGKMVLYLQFVINNYQECICCGTRRSTIEGVQQHMVAKGHCRFEISLDTEDFYEIPQSDNIAAEPMQRDSSLPVRLPSGKLIANRKNVEAQEPRQARRAPQDRTRDRNRILFTSRAKGSPLDPSSSTPSLEVAQRRTETGSGEMVRSSEAILAAQLSRLRIAANREQQKFEARKRGKLERAQNILMTKTFRTDSGDGRWDPRY